MKKDNYRLCHKSALKDGGHRMDDVLGRASNIRIEVCRDCGVLRFAVAPMMGYPTERWWLYFTPTARVYEY